MADSHDTCDFFSWAFSLREVKIRPKVFESRLLSHETGRLFKKTREAHQYTRLLLPPCTFRHLSRGRIHARIRRFSTFVFTSSPSLRKTLYVNRLSVKASPPFFLHPCLHRRFWEFIHYAHFMRNEVTKRPLCGTGAGTGWKDRGVGRQGERRVKEKER